MRAIFRRITTLIPVALWFITGCSLLYPKKEAPVVLPPYEQSNQQFSDEFFRSSTGDLIGKYPAEWLQINIENIPQLQDLTDVYTNPDRSSVLVINEITGTADLRRKVDRDGIIAVAEESIRLRKGKILQMEITRFPEVYPLGNAEYVSYEYTIPSQNPGYLLHHRIACVATGVRFYEIGIMEVSPNITKNGYIENFRLLQSVITSLQGIIRLSSTVDNISK